MNCAVRRSIGRTERLVDVGLALSLLFMAACATTGRTQTPEPGRKEGAVKGSPAAYAPKPEDSRLTRGQVMIEQTSLANGVLRIAGNLPTPCHEIRVNMPAAVDATGTFAIETWSVYDAGKMCTQMLQPFSIQVPLVPAATNAKITVNGQAAGLATR